MLIVEHGDHPVPDEPNKHKRLRPTSAATQTG
jgi:hypothetical protein